MAPSRRLGGGRLRATAGRGRGATSLPRIRTASTEGAAFAGASAVEARGGLEVGVVSAQGRRPYQEDEYVVRPVLRPRGQNAPTVHTAMFGIYDGHAGGRCSKAVASTLPDILMQQAGYEQNLPSALQQAYHATNEEFLKVAERLKLHDGSTGITAILRDMKLTVANVGDCRAVLIRAGQAKQITVDHKPTDPVEMKRISALGGTVVNRMGVYRVNGVLAVSRAFGNRSLKQVIRPDADIFSVKLVPEDDYLVQASDGLWDVLRNKDVTDICYQFDHDGPQRIAQELVAAALARGSTDNTTAMVVHLGPFIQRQLKLASSVKKDFSASAVGAGVGAGWYDAKDDFSRATVAGNASPSRPLSRMFGNFLRSSAGSPVDDDVDDPELTQHAPLGKKGSGFLDMLWSDRGSARTPTGGAMTPTPPLASPIQMSSKRLVRPGTTQGSAGMGGRASALMQMSSRPSHSPITVPKTMRRPNTRGGF